MIAEFSEHEADGSKAQEGEGFEIEVFPVLGQPSAAIEPCQGALDHPSSGQNGEALRVIGPFDDLGFDMRQGLGQGLVKHRPLIGAVGEEFLQEWEQAKEGGQQQNTAVPVLNVGRMNDRVQEQPLRVYEYVPFLALDPFARVEPRRIDAGPPFSALFTLWLSMMQAVGLASRPACFRHFS